MPDTRRCPQCDAPLADQTAQGLCPACLVKVGMASQSQSLPGNDAQAIDPRLSATLTHTPGQAADGPARPELRLPEPGERFGDYQIARTLGKGGMGAVYEAEQLSTGRRVALKVLKHSLDSSDARKRFLREGRLAASINHPNSVYVFGTEEIDGTPAITMELVAGGTLQERVKQKGPLAIGEAVDIILQIIAGLEAAQKLGVLHRDIKPANCFVDVHGAVKVGDFGLSISTAPRAESDVTHSGSFLGTPAFASPEQLRGDELNVRSDMYSVGVTLYYLLTGRTPFNADNLVKLLATVLERSAESPKKWRPEIPQGLAQVVLRCLEKQPTDRFKTYDELRQALLPFASAAPTPAPLGLRFVAAVLDHWSWAIVMWSLTLLGASFLSPLNYASSRFTWQTFGYWIVTLSMYALYIGIPEGLWGASVGKWICRLRVVNTRREPPGILKALVRVIVVALGPALNTVLQWSIPLEIVKQFGLVFGLMTPASYALLIVTVRKTNGLACIHDLLTATRVILRPAHQVRSALPDADDSLPATQTATIGPYHVLDVFEKHNGEEWILGYDTRLLRRVWIHKLPVGAAPTPSSERNVARAGRLRWLNGKRSPTENWDAYEALIGRPLVKLLDHHQPWASVRFWLLDLAEELDAATKDGTLPESLSLDRVWITAEGRAKLLDFAPPGLDRLDTAKPATPIDPSDAPGRRRFLNQVAIAALEGKAADAAEASTRAAKAPLPIVARNLLDHLAQPGDENELATSFQPLVRQSPTVSRRRRTAIVLACCLPMVFVTAMVGVMFWGFRQFNQLEPGVLPLFSSLNVLDELKTGEHDDLKAKPEDIHDLEVLIVHRYHKLIADPKGLSGPMAQSLFTEPKRQELARVVTAHPNPSAEEVQAAKKNPTIQAIDLGTELGLGYFNQGLLIMMLALPLGGLVLVALLSLASAALFRRGLVFRTFDIAIVTADGTPASRGRAFWRALIAWSLVWLAPILLTFVIPLVALATKSATTPSDQPTLTDEQSEEDAAAAFLDTHTTVLVMTIAGACGSVWIVLVVWSLLLPGRGLADRLARTWLVPA